MAGAIPPGLGSKESELLGILARDPGVKISDVADRIDISQSAVKRPIGSLKEKGLLSSEGTDRRSVWAVRCLTDARAGFRWI